MTAMEAAMAAAQEGRSARIAQATANLCAWLATMRQEGGYGGVVAHWWRHSLLYAGPGLDWRYEGILCGYASLVRRTGDPAARRVLDAAVQDLLAGFVGGHGLLASEFEINPGTLGTPHEAAAVLGLLDCVDLLEESRKAAVVGLATAVLDNLINHLWNNELVGFNDRPQVRGTVPNKLATLAEALLRLYELSGQQRYLAYAKSCVDDVLRYQVGSGRFKGAIHQYGPDAGEGDGRFFPYYNARCIPGLLHATRALGDTRYQEAAQGVGAFVREVIEDDHWPQIVYGNRRRARFPSWVAGSADVLRALALLGDDVMAHPALDRLLGAQLAHGGFPTAEGFSSRLAGQRGREKFPSADWLDVLPVCGWNDKVFRLLCELLPPGQALPPSEVTVCECDVGFYGMPARYHEDGTEMWVRVSDRVVVRWTKGDQWMETQFRPPAL
jgi:hypothetical protein